MGPLRRSFRLPRRTRRQIAAEVDEEIGFHLAERAAQFARLGHEATEARELAARRFGEIERTRDAMRDSTLRREGRMRRRDVGERIWQDVRYTLRQLRREPGFAAVAILTLAVGIAANAVMFGVVDRLLLRPPPHVVEPERVGRLHLARTWDDGETSETSNISYYRLQQLRAGGREVADVAGLFAYGQDHLLGRGADAERVRGGYATANLFPLLGVRPLHGRFFTEAEDTPPSGTPVVVLGHGLWRRRFGGDSTVLGTTVRVQSADYTVVGIAPPGFAGLGGDEVDLWLPATTRPNERSSPSRPVDTDWATQHNMSWIEAVVRLRPGVTPERAGTVLGEVYARSIADEYDAAEVATARPRVLVAPAQRERGPNRSASTRVSVWLTGVAAAVLLVACANVANLLLARGVKRRREVAVRLALGVSRARLVTQLLLESLVLAVGGAAVGLLLAYWAGAAVSAVLLPEAGGAAVFDGRVLAFTAAAAIVAGVLAGLVPALQASSPDLAGALRAGVREGGGRRSGLRAALLVTQAALSVVLLVGAGLFVRSLREARAADLGFEPERVVLATVDWRGTEPADTDARAALDAQVVERLRAVPGVQLATTTQSLPNYRNMTMSLFTAGRDTVRGGDDMYMNAAGSDFFATLGARLLRGRTFDGRDAADAERVMIVSASMARRVWPQGEALGRCLRIGADTMPCATVVGVADNVIQFGLDADSTLQYWIPQPQAGPRRAGAYAYLARVTGDPATAVPAVRAAMQAVLPADAYPFVRPMRELTDPTVQSWRLGATMFVAFGALSLVIAAVGLYGVIAYHVQQRRHELGVRQALGARAADLHRAVLGEGLRVVAAGLAVGALVSLAASRWLEPLLYQVSPRDPVTYAAVVLALLAAAVVACVGPARRAARVDPSEALRAE